MKLSQTALNNGTLPITQSYDYCDLMAMYTNPGGTTLQDAENSLAWALKDATGNPLYVNYSVPYQMAADPSNPAWRTRMLEWLLTRVRMGFWGLELDDVNLSLQTICNAQGVVTAPVPAQNGVAMTDVTFAAAVNDFCAWLKSELKTAWPSLQIMHNTPWRESPGGIDSWKDPLVIAGWASTDLVVKENGFGGDTGITGGTGFWSLSALLAYCDAIHAHGKGVLVLETDPASALYSVACSLLMTNGADYWELRGGTAPAQAYQEYGQPLTDRRRIFSGLWLREFDKAIVLVSEPGAAQQTFAGVTLGPKQGVILAL